MKQLIKEKIDKALKKLDITIKDYSITVNEKIEFGDYSTNVGLIIKKADEIAAELKKDDLFEKIETKNGFINLFIRQKYLLEKIEDFADNKSFPSFQLPTTSYNIEFISANPTGPLTIGNGRGGFYGDVLSNILEYTGNKVTREYYINDVGKQIEELKKSIEGTGESYKGDYIKQLRLKIKDERLKNNIVDLILNKYIKPTTSKLNIDFDQWFYESSLHPKSIDMAIAKLKEKDLIYEKDEAVWVKTTEFGDDKDRVVKTKTGEYTYFASDIAYLLNKIGRGFDKLVFLWGADHHGYIGRIKAAAKAFGIEADKIHFIIFQLVRLTKDGREYKVSKRLGNIVTLDDLINEVGLDAGRYFFLAYDPNTHMDFDIDLAKEKSKKNPVYYIQYAYVRLRRIIQNAKLKMQNCNSKFKIILPTELPLVKKLIQFEDVISEIAENYNVFKLPQYAYELAREIQLFYEKNRIIGNEREKERIYIANASLNVLAKCLDLMGISKPNSM